MTGDDLYIEINDIITQCNVSLVEQAINTINRINLGFVQNDCKVSSIIILKHCCESYEMFNEEQIEKVKRLNNNIHG